MGLSTAVTVTAYLDLVTLLNRGKDLLRIIHVSIQNVTLKQDHSDHI